MTDKGVVKLDGLNQKQVDMLDKLWSCFTVDDLKEYMGTLNTEDFHMAIVLQEMLFDAIMEEEVDEMNLTEAQKMLQSIGVKL